jgi:hypothetical protein
LTHFFKNVNSCFEGLIALGTSASLITLLRKPNPEIGLWTLLLGLSAVAAILKPVLGVQAEIERYAKLRLLSSGLYYDLKDLAERIATEHDMTREMRVTYRKTLKRSYELLKDDDPYHDPERVLRLTNEVKRRHPVDMDWAPA